VVLLTFQVLFLYGSPLVAVFSPLPIAYGPLIKKP
jgi:hypothetical protein